MSWQRAACQEREAFCSFHPWRGRGEKWDETYMRAHTHRRVYMHMCAVPFDLFSANAMQASCAYRRDLWRSSRAAFGGSYQCHAATQKSRSLVGPCKSGCLQLCWLVNLVGSGGQLTRAGGLLCLILGNAGGRTLISLRWLAAAVREKVRAVWFVARVTESR